MRGVGWDLILPRNAGEGDREAVEGAAGSAGARLPPPSPASPVLPPFRGGR
jgi:hypothetical protein